MSDFKITGLDEVIAHLVKQHQIAIDKLTEEQVAQAIKQAIESGDFQIEVRGDLPTLQHSQRVIYLPGMGNAELRAKIERLEKQIEGSSALDE